MSKIDETLEFLPNYNGDGLIAAIAQDRKTKDILMLAWMNEEAFNQTLRTGEAHYWSRSRRELWHKGATSGAVQIVHDMRIDCDQDAIILMVDQKAQGACHTGRANCFYRQIKNLDGTITLAFVDDK